MNNEVVYSTVKHHSLRFAKELFFLTSEAPGDAWIMAAIKAACRSRVRTTRAIIFIQ